MAHGKFLMKKKPVPGFTPMSHILGGGQVWKCLQCLRSWESGSWWYEAAWHLVNSATTLVSKPRICSNAIGVLGNNLSITRISNLLSRAWFDLWETLGECRKLLPPRTAQNPREPMCPQFTEGHPQWDGFPSTADSILYYFTANDPRQHPLTGRLSQRTSVSQLRLMLS